MNNNINVPTILSVDSSIKIVLNSNIIIVYNRNHGWTFNSTYHLHRSHVRWHFVCTLLPVTSGTYLGMQLPQAEPGYSSNRTTYG